MQEITGELFDQPGVLCITTNGFIKKDGSCVMGRGCARQAKELYSGIEYELGRLIRENGNHVQVIQDGIVAFPVKHNWWEEADLELIEQSCEELVDLADTHGWDRVTLPRPGCGNGKLDWDVVKLIVSEYLDDRFYVITF